MAWLHAVIDVPAEQHASAAGFWTGALGWPLGAPWRAHPELRSFAPPHGDSYVHLQQIVGRPRVHLDVESDETDATVARSVDLGATLVGEQCRWVTLVSPGGLQYCVVAAGEHEPPAPSTWPGGHRSRMVQICIDSPAAAHEREVDFWRGLLPGRWADSSAPEFAGKWHDDAGSPIQLLFQRLDESTGEVRAHLDHGTDDVRAEVRRLQGLGAVEVGPGRGWFTMRDPAGLAFCVTGNSPEQTRHRDIG